MKIVQKFLLAFLGTLILVFISLLVFPSLINFIPETYKSEDFLNILDKVLIPLGSIIGVIILILTYLIQLDEKNQNTKKLIYRELKIRLEIFTNFRNGVFNEAIKVVLTNTSYSNIYLSNFFISFYPQSLPDTNDYTFECPLKIKLEHGQFEEQILDLSKLFEEEIRNGYLIVKIKITDSLGKEYFCDEIKLSEIQKNQSFNIIMDKNS